MFNYKLDSLLSTIKFKGTDSIPCASNKSGNDFNHQLYIDFYNEQIGKYFSDASNIAFAKRYYKNKRQSTYDEISIVHFELPKENILKIDSVYGKGSDGYRYFKLKVFTLYKFIIKDNDIFFISTPSYHPGEKESFLDKVAEIFISYTQN